MHFVLEPLVELPLILSLSFAVYLSFEYWRFPDLTIETVFVSGMVASYLGTGLGNSVLAEFLWTLFFAIVFVGTYSFLTLSLFLFRFPPLFAGLIVLLFGFSVNFFLNGQQASQSMLGSEIIILVKDRSSDGTLTPLWLMGLGLTLTVIGAVFVFDKTKTGAKLRLLRQIDNKELVASLSRRPIGYLWIAMLVYNFVAVTGGIAWGLSNAFSHVESLGLVTVGLATMFLVRAIRSVAAAPTRTRRNGGSRKLGEAVLVKTDSLMWIFVIVVLSSLALSIGRFFINGIPAFAYPGAANALTAASIIVIWIAVIAFGSMLGRQLPDEGKN